MSMLYSEERKTGSGPLRTSSLRWTTLGMSGYSESPTASAVSAVLARRSEVSGGFAEVDRLSVRATEIGESCSE